jgi:hypothetical protein
MRSGEHPAGSSDILDSWDRLHITECGTVVDVERVDVERVVDVPR